jgi:mannose-1-phosphate guanylyltransferase
VLLSNNGQINAFGEKSGRREPGLVNAGVYAFQTDLLDRMKQQPPFSLERDVFPQVAETGSLWAWKTNGPLIDIGTPERYLDAQTRLTTLMTATRDPNA